MSQVVIVSSNANNGTNAGRFILNSNNDSSNANRNIGRQLVVSFDKTKTPALMGEYDYPIQSGSFCERLGEKQR